jgi:hypothetical protein
MLQAPDPLHPSRHECPQLPQLLPSVLVLTQLVPHHVCPGGQQWLLLQCWAPLHVMPQLPQLALSVARLAHPLAQQDVPVPQLVPHAWQ